MRNSFSLKYIGKEDHLIMPSLTKLVVTQTLYDILFQYVIEPEKERKLLEFIERIRTHMSDNAYRNTPFSVPVTEMQFLEEGLEELKLLCWQVAPVYTFAVEFPLSPEAEGYEAVRDEVGQILSDLFVYNWQGNDRILVYSALPL